VSAAAPNPFVAIVPTFSLQSAFYTDCAPKLKQQPKMDDQLKQSALDFQQFSIPGNIQVSPTKPLATQRDLALACSPGVAALGESLHRALMPDSPLKGAANLLIMPNVETARISYNLLHISSSEGVTLGPVLMGISKPVHALTRTASVRRVVNMAALAVVEAQTAPL